MGPVPLGGVAQLGQEGSHLELGQEQGLGPRKDTTPGAHGLAPEQEDHPGPEPRPKES